MEEKTYTLMQTPDGKALKGQDMKFTPVQEEWSIYALEDGSKLRVRATALKISRAIDPETERMFMTSEGEPYYGVRVVPRG